MLNYQNVFITRIKSMFFINELRVKLKNCTNSFIFLIFLFFSQTTIADSCDWTSAYGWSVHSEISAIGSGVSTVGEDLPAGATIYSYLDSSTFNKGRYISYSCDFTGNDSLLYTKIDAVSTPSGPAVISGGQSIYPTNIPGVGVIFTIATTGRLSSSSIFPSTYEFSGITGASVVTTIMPLNQIAFKLVKIGTINASGTQQVLMSSFPTFHVSVGSISPIASENLASIISFSGAIALYTKTCQIAVPDINVNLGHHPLSAFKAPGTTTEWKSFDIILQNCPPFYGYGSYENYYGTIYDKVENNKVALTFNSVNGVVESNPALASIESGPDAAQGIGIEMTQQDDSASIPMDGSSGFELQNLTTTNGGTYVIPLRARYVQYDSSVKAGVANGAVVFTIIYQ